MMKAPRTVILRNSLINKLGTFNGFSKRKILYFATCFCFILALLLLALSFSFLISLLTNFSSGVSNSLKALDRAFLTFCLSFAEFVSLGIATSYGGKQNKMLLIKKVTRPAQARRRKCAHVRPRKNKTILRPDSIADSLESQLRSLS